MPKKIYEATYCRDGRWFIISIPSIGQVTQARFASEMDIMARECISLVEDIPINDVGVLMTYKPCEYDE